MADPVIDTPTTDVVVYSPDSVRNDLLVQIKHFLDDATGHFIENGQFSFEPEGTLSILQSRWGNELWDFTNRFNSLKQHFDNQVFALFGPQISALEGYLSAAETILMEKIQTAISNRLAELRTGFKIVSTSGNVGLFEVTFRHRLEEITGFCSALRSAKKYTKRVVNSYPGLAERIDRLERWATNTFNQALDGETATFADMDAWYKQKPDITEQMDKWRERTRVAEEQATKAQQQANKAITSREAMVNECDTLHNLTGRQKTDIIRLTGELQTAEEEKATLKQRLEESEATCLSLVSGSGNRGDFSGILDRAAVRTAQDRAESFRRDCAVMLKKLKELGLADQVELENFPEAFGKAVEGGVPKRPEPASDLGPANPADVPAEDVAHKTLAEASSGITLTDRTLQAMCDFAALKRQDGEFMAEEDFAGSEVTSEMRVRAHEMNGQFDTFDVIAKDLGITVQLVECILHLSMPEIEVEAAVNLDAKVSDGDLGGLDLNPFKPEIELLPKEEVAEIMSYHTDDLMTATDIALTVGLDEAIVQAVIDKQSTTGSDE